MIRAIFVFYCMIACSLGAKAGMGVTAFSAEATNEGKVALSWTSPLSGSSLVFRIYHSADGISWVEIERISGPETDKGELLYTSSHEARQGVHYYRIAYTAGSGPVFYSNTIFTEVKENLPGTAPFPNPANDRLYISCDSETEAQAYTLYNAAGDKKQNVVFGYSGQGLYTMDLSGMSPGFYFLRGPRSNHRILIR